MNDRRWLLLLGGLLAALVVVAAWFGLESPSAIPGPARTGSAHRPHRPDVPPPPPAGSSRHEGSARRIGKGLQEPGKASRRSGGRGVVAPGHITPGFFPKLHGTVTDVETQAPIRGARVTYMEFDGEGTSLGSWRARTDEKGEFSFKATTWKAVRRFELLVEAKGYERWKGTPPATTVEVQLSPFGLSPLPGAIRGTVTDAQGRPITGIVEVIVQDENDVSSHWWIRCSDDGTYELCGLHPGRWRVFLDWSGPKTSVYVPTESSAWADLHTPSVKGWQPFLGPKTAARARCVVLTDLPRTSAASVVAVAKSLKGRSGYPQRWRERVTAGSATFPALLPGTWILKYDPVDGKSKTMKLEVPTGTGRVVVRFKGK